jgi:hypothetical protein
VHVCNGTGTGLASGAAKAVAEAVTYARDKGVTGTAGAAIWFNGQIFEEVGNARSVIMYALQYEVQKLQASRPSVLAQVMLLDFKPHVAPTP